jgi:hypothetical protein
MPTTSSGRWLVGIAVGVGALVILSFAVTLLSSGTPPRPLPVGSPEARVQDFILAIDDGELDAAYDMLDPDAVADCSRADFRQRASYGERAGLRVALRSVDIYDDQADVSVSVSSFSGSPPFDFSENNYDVRFALAKHDQTWAITLAPWPFSGCPFTVKSKPAATPVPVTTLTPKDSAS